MGELHLISTYRKGGEAVQNLEMFQRAWDECAELQCTDKQTWVQETLWTLQKLDRYEIGVHNGDKVVGGVHLAWDFDVHVHRCLSVFAQYVLPEYRLRGVSPRLMREAIRLAREARAPVLAFTHRKGPWQYSTIYRRVK